MEVDEHIQCMTEYLKLNKVVCEKHPDGYKKTCPVVERQIMEAVG